MKLASKIFRRNDWYVTSNYGYRDPIKTSAGVTRSFHNGTDYGTNVQKWGQYAIETGKILSCGKDIDGALFVWVEYPRINKKLLHYHLDSLAVKAGQAVVEGTLLGYTGTTGKSTGIHLHLGVKDSVTGKFEDPHAYNYVEYVAPTKSVEEVANEVINGLWGNGKERKERLTNAGYDYSAVQNRVNEILAPKPAPVYKTYIVQRGDNLSKIAGKFGTSWEKLYADNKELIDNTARAHGVNIKFYNYIYAGMQLIIK